MQNASRLGLGLLVAALLLATTEGVIPHGARQAESRLGGHTAHGNGLEPSAWFIDPMHLTMEGHDALAQMVAQSVVPMLSLSPPSLAPAPLTERELAGCGGEGCRVRKAFRPELDLDFGQFKQ